MDIDSEVFLSWSGDTSQRIAEKLRSWLPLLLDSLKLWISSEDLQEGTRWSTELFEHLEKCHLGVFIVTPENCTAPWMMFEAGALSKSLDRGKVVPYLVGFTAAGQLKGPLKHFQSARATKAGTLKLVKAINESLPVKTDAAVIEGRFEHLWPSLESFLESICIENTKDDKPVTNNSSDGVARLEIQLSEATEMIRQLVSVWNSAESSGLISPAELSELEALQGNWHDSVSDSYFYFRVINGQLYAPYCYGGNTALVGTLYSWKKLKKYWFARFKWVAVCDEVHGFFFLQQISSDTVEFSWWFGGPDQPDESRIEREGIQSIPDGEYGLWKRNNTPIPDWANEYFAERLAESSMLG